MTTPPATSLPDQGADHPRRPRISSKVGVRSVIISVVALVIIAFLLHHRAPRQPYLRMEGLLESRLARYHPVLKWLNGDAISEEVSTIEEGKKPPAKELNLAFEIDLPLRPATRGVLQLWMREYPDVETAATHFKWLETSGVRRTASQSTPMMPLLGPQGFDKLSVDTNVVVGLLGRRHFEITLQAEGSAQPDLLVWGPPGSSDHFICTGLAAMMLDVWQEAQGQPHIGLDPPFPPAL